MYDGTGAQVASLTYDAYGNTVSVTNPNGLYIPFRYRGYYFDEETGFYYLQSRYYDPETGRFINADDVGYLGESNYLNLFAYCGNNPVMFTDPTGKTPTLSVTIFTLNDDMLSELYYRLLVVCKKWEDEVTIGDYIMWFCTAAIEVISMVVSAPNCFRFDEVYSLLIETLEKYSKELAGGRMEALYGIPRYEYELPPGTSLL